MRKFVTLLFLVGAFCMIGSKPLFAQNCVIGWDGWTYTPFGVLIAHDNSSDLYTAGSSQECSQDGFDDVYRVAGVLCQVHPAARTWYVTTQVYFNNTYVTSYGDNRTCNGINDYNTLSGGQSLNPGSSISSPSGVYNLKYQDDGNLVFYNGSSAVWAINCWPTCRPDWFDPWTGGYPPGHTDMQTDGNFVVYNQAGNFIYNSQTNGNDGAFLAVRNDGNLVIFSSNGAILWRKP